MSARIIVGDCRDGLAMLATSSHHCCVTSPPYFGLRDYGVAGQLGAEENPEHYVSALVGVFRDVRRVLRMDGVLFLNIGDSYASGDRTWRAPNTNGMRSETNFVRMDNRPSDPDGIKPKDLLGIPWMLAFALRNDGWYLRSDIIWHKPNPIPESVKDRPTKSHEYVFMLTPSKSYFYDSEAISEDVKPETAERYKYEFGGVKHEALRNGDSRIATVGFRDTPTKRNSRSVWIIPTKSFSGAHFATMAPALAERCILAGSSEGGCCAVCGVPFERVVEVGDHDLAHQRACGGDATGAYLGKATKDYAAAGAQDSSATKARILAGMRKRKTIGWSRSCDCPSGPGVPCRILDPFGGAGTTGLAAGKLGRDATMIEINRAYAEMARTRISGS